MINLSAVVTGGSSGIGKALVNRLAREGYRVYTMSRDSEYYRETLTEWEAHGNIIPLTGSVNRDEDVQRLSETVMERESRLDLLVNNAGIYIREDGGFPSLETMGKNLETNTMACYRVIRSCLPLLERSHRPVIINISSGAGSISSCSSHGPLAYRVSKAAVNMLTRSMSFDLRDRGIVIHAVDPGYIKTRLNPDGTGSPEHAAENILFLTKLYDMEQTGQFWCYGKAVPW